MSYKQMTGNIISATKVEPAGVFTNSAASGVWNLQDQYDYNRGGNWPNAANALPIGLMSGTSNASVQNTTIIEQITIATLGDGTDFGDLTAATGNAQIGANASSTRAIWSAVGGATNVMEYVTFATKGNTTDWGDQTGAISQRAGCGSATRGLIGGGYSGGIINTIDLFTLASTGDASDFGDLSAVRRYLGAGSSETRGIFMGGDSNVLDYVTIASAGNASDFGDLLYPGFGCRSGTSKTRAVITPGSSSTLNSLQYITMASTGNSVDFGDLTLRLIYVATMSSVPTDRAVYAAGYDHTGQTTDVIQYTTISTLGNALDFGDVSFGGGLYGVGCSNVHGGLA